MVDYTLSGNGSSNVLKVPNWAWDYDFAIFGNGGHDTLIAGNGDDDLYGGAGNDTLNGGYGWNYLDGGTGFDTVDYSFFNTGSSLGMYIDLSLGQAWDRPTGGGYVDDELVSIEGVTGSARADIIIGNSASNVLKGGAGSDDIRGGGGNDDIYGNRGSDLLTGGSGYDYFIFESINDSNAAYGRDTITDFQLDVDMIDLSSIDAKTGVGGNNAFAWKGYDATFNGSQGELHFFYTGAGASAKTVIEGDINGDRVADIQIFLTGHKFLVGSDFIL
ncbi:MAG: M10 family metallopeptidase C-terminal domain-containing protein [Proteobacteria bacterium]|nr:M10 family metallopeptidase C-terminal domain-containing protein [Pseudomonadota bacterium]